MLRTIFNKVINLLRITQLKCKGVKIDFSAQVSWLSEVSLMGGTISIGKNTTIDRGVILRAYSGSISIGNNCSVNPFSVLYGHGGLEIGNGVRIATHTVCIPSNHIYKDSNKEIRLQGETKKGIHIGSDVWIGTGARILDGVHIYNGCIIAAGAVVTTDCLPYTVYAGVPATAKKTRGHSTPDWK